MAFDKSNPLFELFQSNPTKWMAIEIRAEIMAAMLCGDIEWHIGCYMRSLSDEVLIQKLEETEHGL